MQGVAAGTRHSPPTNFLSFPLFTNDSDSKIALKVLDLVQQQIQLPRMPFNFHVAFETQFVVLESQ